MRPQRQSSASGTRRPGPTPNINAHVVQAQAALQRAPENLRELLADIITPLVSAIQNQDVFNRRQQARYASLPAPHGRTHLGGQDNIVSDDDPEALTPDSEGDPGDATEGVSARGHVHDMSAFAFLGDLDGLTTEELNGDQVVMVYSPEENELLQEILIELDKANDALTEAAA